MLAVVDSPGTADWQVSVSNALTDPVSQLVVFERLPFAGDARGSQFALSLAGPVTFKNARNLHEVARYVPADRLLVETDSPYLSPEPVRGRRNEPAHVRHTAADISVAAQQLGYRPRTPLAEGLAAMVAAERAQLAVLSP